MAKRLRSQEMCIRDSILTYTGLKKYEDELHDLKVNKRQEIAQKIKEAREQGDLSENAEYDAAKDEQRDIEARIVDLEKLLSLIHILIVTGMSGAGKTAALKMLEDMGFYCVDNLPIPLVGKFAELVQSSSGEVSCAALGIDVRSGDELAQLEGTLNDWNNIQFPYEILFLDASDEVLIKRYKETRRSHPLAGKERLDRGIAKERLKLDFLKKRADYILDRCV